MTTEAQTEANRANAQKSTGPRTPEGKAKVAQNALKHGLLAKQAVVVGEDTDDFDLLRDQFRAELAPVGLTESRLVERIAGLSWRLQRAERFHTESFDVMCQQCADDPQIKRWRPRLVPDAADPVVGLTVVKDFSETKVLDRLLMYERRIENSLYRTMAELHKVQGQRQGAVGGPATSPRRAVRDTHPMDFSMEQDRGGPFHRVPETLPPDFTLDNLLAKIAALEEPTPAGTTTNTPPAQRQSCETKPISAAMWHGHPFGFARRAGLPANGPAAGCPLPPAGSDLPDGHYKPTHRPRANRAKQSQFAADGSGMKGQGPNSAVAGRRDRPCSESCDFQHSSARRRSRPRAKQSQSPPERRENDSAIPPSSAGADNDRAAGGAMVSAS